MFIPFPTMDFQFKITEGIQEEDLISWLIDNNITSFGALEIRGGMRLRVGNVYTVRSSKLYYSLSTVVPDLPLIDILETNKSNQLLVKCIDSVLKEIGYFRLGQEDIVIKKLKQDILAIIDINNKSNRYILNLIDSMHIIDYAILSDSKELRKSKYKIHLFYSCILSIAIKSFSFFDEDRTNSLIYSSSCISLYSLIYPTPTSMDRKLMNLFPSRCININGNLPIALKELRKLRTRVQINRELFEEVKQQIIDS